MMAQHLNRPSRATIVRFTVKVCVSMLLAALSKGGFFLAASAWLILYSAFTAILAVLLKEKVEKESFNHLDEMLWLVATSQVFEMAHRVSS